MYFRNRTEAIQYIKDYANGSMYYTDEYELNEYLSRQQIKNLMKKYNVVFTYNI